MIPGARFSCLGSWWLFLPDEGYDLLSSPLEDILVGSACPEHSLAYSFFRLFFTDLFYWLHSVPWRTQLYPGQ